MPNLADLLSRSAAEHADSVAIKLDQSELSYAALDVAAARAAALLRANTRVTSGSSTSFPRDRPARSSNARSSRRSSLRKEADSRMAAPLFAPPDGSPS